MGDRRRAVIRSAASTARENRGKYKEERVYGTNSSLCKINFGGGRGNQLVNAVERKMVIGILDVGVKFSDFRVGILDFGC